MDTLVTLPGVRIQEVQLSGPPIAGVSTSTPGFVGMAPTTAVSKDRFLNELRLVTSPDQFFKDYIYKPGTEDPDAVASTALSWAVLGFFQNGGGSCYVVNVGSEAKDKIIAGLKILERSVKVQIIAAPGITELDVYVELQGQAERCGDRFAILDPPGKSDTGDLVKLKKDGGKRPNDSPWSAFYYPRIQVSPVLADDKDPAKTPPPIYVTPTGHIAGLYARVDALRGVHKAPANEVLYGAVGVEHPLTDSEQNDLNKEGVDAIRLFATGPTVWGARTLLGEAAGNKTFLYLNVRRLTTYIEQSLKVGLRFAVFEPNNLPLRQKISRSVRGFLDGVWRDGALFGATADEAYYVRFPDAFNTDDDRANGKLTIEIGLRVSYPAEFIIVRIGLLLQSASTA
ncbi:phage tail sheath family protein [Bradyrhizobium diazoefficiens]